MARGGCSVWHGRMKGCDAEEQLCPESLNCWRCRPGVADPPCVSWSCRCMSVATTSAGRQRAGVVGGGLGRWANTQALVAFTGAMAAGVVGSGRSIVIISAGLIIMVMPSA